MIQLTNRFSLHKYAKLVGAIYIIIAIVGGFSIGTMPSKLFVAGDANTTAQNIINNLVLFHAGIAGDIVVIVLEVLLTVMLYNLFKTVSTTWARVAAFSRLAMAIVMAINLLNYFVPVILLSGKDYLNTFTQEQLNSLTLVFLQAHKYGEYVWQLFFGLHMFALGRVIIKSGYFHKAIGVLILLGSIGYGGDSFVRFVGLNIGFVPIVIGVFLSVAVIGELALAFWLLIKGVNKRWLAALETNA
jgi:hypothetical protein